ncbi:hypothetical protein [Trinickia terrae]|nr:hypothetical protein [Trinickia terrae]
MKGVPDNVRAVFRSNKMSYLVGAVFGAAIVTVVGVKAQQALTTPSATDAYPCAIATAANTALNNQITIIGTTQPDPSKYFTVGGVSSCIGPIANIDLSNLIPDPMGLLTSLAQAAIQTAVQKACTAVRSSLSDYIGKYNQVAGMINGGTQGMLSTALGQAVGMNLTNYGTNYAAPAGSQLVVNPLATVTNAANAAVGAQLSSAQQSVTSTVQSTLAPVNSAYKSAAGSVTSAVSGAVTSVQNGVQNGATSLGNSIFGASN